MAVTADGASRTDGASGTDGANTARSRAPVRVEPFFDPRTSTLSYVAWDEAERVGVVIDPVLDFDAASGRTWTESADRIARFIEGQDLSVPFVLDTHAHADHLSALAWFKTRFGAATVTGAKISAVQRVFRDLFHLGDDFPTDGSQFDLLLGDEDALDARAFEIRALHTPGHTPACLCYAIGDALFVGDALFMPDYGTARCDFPGGSADELYDSVQRLYRELPDSTRVFTCHDYQPGGRELQFESTLLEQRRSNVQLDASTRREDFIAFRRKRDATLSMPELILPAVQVNIRAGALPEPEANGIAYFKIPLNVLGEKR